MEGLLLPPYVDQPSDIDGHRPVRLRCQPELYKPRV